MANESFDILDKDIKWTHLGHGIYDRKIVSGDYVKAENLESLSTACEIKIMTAVGEMVNNPTYGGEFGNGAWKLIKQNKNELTMMQIRDKIWQALEEMSRVKMVNDVTVKEYGFDNELKVTYSVKAMNDQDVNGGVLIG